MIELLEGTTFTELRPQQKELLDKLTMSGRRFDVAAAPTGVGKSLLAWSYAKLMGTRTVILTKTKALQDQYMRDFAAAGLVDVRGMGNYDCLILPGGSCAEGPCMDGEQCPLRNGGCLYFDAVKNAILAPIVVTNYDFWFAHKDGLGTRDLLVLDEAHAVRDEVAQAAGAHFSGREVRLTEGMLGRSLAEWRDWAAEQAEKVLEVLDGGRTTPAERRKLRSLLERFGRLAKSDDEWDFDYVPGRFLRAEPIIPAQHSERVLFRGIGKVLLLSATIRPADLDELGVPEEMRHYYETDSPFPVDRRPIYIVEAGARMTSGVTQVQIERWAAKIDEVIETRKGAKGIIHTVSYARAKLLKEKSRFRELMMIHPPDELMGTVETFKRMHKPGILVSPSVHTGFDFPYEEARWQIIAKVPFPDTRMGLAKARAARDEKYIQRHAASTMIQMAGRVMRAEDDNGETFVVDDSINWLYSRYRPYFPMWWRKALRLIPKDFPIPPPIQS